MLALHDPVVDVVVEVAVPHLEVQILEHCLVVHQVEAVVHIEVVLLAQHQRTLD